MKPDITLRTAWYCQFDSFFISTCEIVILAVIQESLATNSETCNQNQLSK